MFHKKHINSGANFVYVLLSDLFFFEQNIDVLLIKL